MLWALILGLVALAIAFVGIDMAAPAPKRRSRAAALAFDPRAAHANFTARRGQVDQSAPTARFVRRAAQAARITMSGHH